jgi:hypothetical protein
MEKRVYLESTIPLILIAILAIFIAGKFGLVDLHAIPVVGSLFPAPALKVVVIGSSGPDMKGLLSSEVFRLQGVTYGGDLPQNAVLGGVLNSFDIVILYRTPTCDRSARKAITDKVKGGGKLIVIGDACTRVSDDPLVLGWDIGIGLLSDVMPVRYGGVLAHEYVSGARQVLTTGKFRVIAPDHPMFGGVVTHPFAGAVTNIVPTANGNPIALIQELGGVSTAQTSYAIIESTGLMMGKVLYFAYDPSASGTSPNLFLNALLYLRGARG